MLKHSEPLAQVFNYYFDDCLDNILMMLKRFFGFFYVEVDQKIKTFSGLLLLAKNVFRDFFTKVPSTTTTTTTTTLLLLDRDARGEN